MTRRTGAAAVIQSDARRLPLPDDTVDLIVTSPPYWAHRTYTDVGERYDGQIGAEPTPAAYVDNLIDCTREWLRVLRPTGSLWVNLGDKYARPGGGVERPGTSRGLAGAGRGSVTRRATPGNVGRDKCLFGLPWRYALRCLDDLGLILRAEVIWEKPNPMPESVTDRVRRSHETWFHLTAGPRYFASIDVLRTPRIDPARLDTHPLGRLPGSVWTVPTEPLRVPDFLAHRSCCGGGKRDGCADGEYHYAAFPTEWPRRIIQGWSPSGGTVLDPFGGTGTVAATAKAFGRQGLSCDYSSSYCAIAEWRINDPDQLAKAAGIRRRRTVRRNLADVTLW